MCNNPRYKEPKLNMAQRIASGPLFKESWVELDAEISQAEARWAAAASMVEAPPAARPTSASQSDEPTDPESESDEL